MIGSKFVSREIKKRILYLTQDYPVGQWSGGIIKTLNSINKLSTVYIVDVVCFSIKKNAKHQVDGSTNYYIVNRIKKKAPAYGGKKIKAISLLKGFLSINVPIKPIVSNFIDSLINVYPFSCRNYKDDEFKKIVDKLIEKNVYSAIHVDHITMAQYLPKKKMKNQLFFLEEHDVKTKTSLDIFYYKKSFWSKVFYFYEAIISFFYELKTFHIFDHVFTISEYDVSVIKSFFFLDQTKISAYRPAVAVDKSILKRNISDKQPTLLFLGNLLWQPNKDGFNWFLQNVFPKIKEKIPQVKLYVVGKYNKNEIKNISIDKNIFYYGYKKDIQTFINKCSVFIIPIRINSGFRTKFLTAMSNALPIVSLKKGAVGLTSSEKKIFLEANTKNDFINQTVKLLKDIDLQKELITNSFDYVKKNYSSKNLDLFLEKYNLLVGN